MDDSKEPIQLELPFELDYVLQYVIIPVPEYTRLLDDSARLKALLLTDFKNHSQSTNATDLYKRAQEKIQQTIKSTPRLKRRGKYLEGA